MTDRARILLVTGVLPSIEIPHTFLPGDVVCVPPEESTDDVYENHWFVVRRREFQVERDGRVTHCNVFADAR